MSDSSLLANGELSCSASTVHYENWINEKTAEGGVKSQTNEDTCKEITCTANFVVVNDFTANVQAYMPCFDSECEAVVLNVNSDSTPFELSGPEMSVENRSPYEETPVSHIALTDSDKNKWQRTPECWCASYVLADEPAKKNLAEKGRGRQELNFSAIKPLNQWCL